MSETEMSTINKQRNERLEVETPTSKNWPQRTFGGKVTELRLCGPIAVVLIICIAIVVTIYILKTDSSTGDVTKNQHMSQPTGQALEMKADNILNDCRSRTDIHSFSDIDYSLMGYNIIMGYPPSFGHDPGFTFPIFKANYNGQRSGDCRYMIPDGLVIAPDIACTTSFTSEVLKTTSEMSNFLSESVNIDFGLPVFSFKASAGYKTSMSSISSGNNVYIVSTAKCIYYFSQLSIYSPPQFSQDFVLWVQKLNKSNDSQIYSDFLDYFGTHFPIEITYGAEYIKWHTMSAKKYETATEKGTNLALSATYSNQYEIGGGYNMDENEKKMASEFRELVTTYTITSGASPPADGDEMTWASTVKDDPVPVDYKLKPISDLFTAEFMSSLGVDFQTISNKLTEVYSKYCDTLETKGFINSCTNEDHQITLKSTRLWRHSIVKKVELTTHCIHECIQAVNCFAVTYIKGTGLDCYMFQENSHVYGTHQPDWETVLFKIGGNRTIVKEIILNDTAINEYMTPSHSMHASSKSICSSRCMSDARCAAYSYCRCEERKQNCKHYVSKQIDHFYTEQKTTSYVILGRI